MSNKLYNMCFTGCKGKIVRTEDNLINEEIGLLKEEPAR